MSLINEALKKAQRQRHAEAPAAPGDMTANTGPIAKRPQPKSAKSMLVLVAGGVLLAVLTMVLTTLWLTRPETPSPSSATAEPAPAVVASEPAPAPSVGVPDLTRAVAAAAPAVPDPGVTAKSPVASASGMPDSNPAPVEFPSAGAPLAQAAPASESAPAVPPQPDEQISEFVDALRVTGIRSSGDESKVLMNDRVYRVNDLVDRVRGVRLTKVSSDSLTFSDANGATYVKNF